MVIYIFIRNFGIGCFYMRCFFFLGIDLEWSKFFLSVFDFKFVLL